MSYLLYQSDNLVGVFDDLQKAKDMAQSVINNGWAKNFSVVKYKLNTCLKLTTHVVDEVEDNDDEDSNSETNEYKAHYDSWDHDGSEKTLRCIKYGGPRMLTALVYLNKPEEGGATKFTKLNIDVSPTIGKLLVFVNTPIDEKSLAAINAFDGSEPFVMLIQISFK